MPMAYDRRTEEVAVTQPARRRIDCWVEIGRVHVPVGVAREFTVLDRDRARTLRAWVDALIPARGERPAAGDVGAAEYIDAIVFHAPRVRAILLEAIDAVDGMSAARHNTPFASAEPSVQTAILRAFEAADGGGAFAMIRDLTYEAYYAHPRVLDVLERETGWRYEIAFSGSDMEPFDERLLARMRASAPRWREA
jgi:hypothetical protein